MRNIDIENKLCKLKVNYVNDNWINELCSNMSLHLF
jgi:hypothetical protein